MSPATDELNRICAELPAEKIVEVLDFARFLHEREEPESAGDAAWERIIARQEPRPKLEAFAAAAMAEGPSIPLEGNL